MHNSSGTARTMGETSAGADLVQNYLDNLLREVSVDLDQEQLIKHHPEPAPVMVVAMPDPEPEVVESAISLPDTTVLNLATPELEPGIERVVPDWAQRGFASLLFDVAGLKMAAPLHALGGISQIEDKLQPVAGQADWFMGLLRWNGRNLRVIDTARFVMPERLENNDHQAAYQSVIVLGDSHWALAVDSARQSVNLAADEIRWKKLNGTRPWLAGTLLQRLCALLDVDNLLFMLQQHEQQVRTELGTDYKS